MRGKANGRLLIAPRSGCVMVRNNRWHRTRLLQALAGAALLAAAASGHARAQGTLVMYCGVDENWCRTMATTYQKETGVKVDMIRMSAGETYARIRAEKDNPHGDIWWGGTGDPHLQAAGDRLTEPYASPLLPKLRDWAQRQASIAQNRTVGIYLGLLGFGYNTQELARRKL